MDGRGVCSRKETLEVREGEVCSKVSCELGEEGGDAEDSVGSVVGA